ncbi:MAG TPA: glycosyltransferase [Candidatus Paceibacterota bacterium]|nr:glycosyltransferase [Candidatus Paceibacterota bacterium]
MKRILIFSTAYLPHVGGAEIAIQEITKRLSGEYSFDLICGRFDPELPKEETLGAVQVHRVGWGIRPIDKLLLPYMAALKALELGHFDLYWAMMVTYGSGGAYIARWLTRTPILLTLQEGDPPEYLRTKWFGMVGLAWRLALSRSVVVTVISSYLGALAKAFGYRGEPMLVPNGVDLASFSSVEPIPHTGTVLVTTSRLVHKNAVDDVIRALVLLPEDVTFSIYGVGPDEEKLRSLAKELKVESRVHFHGSIAYARIPEALSRADIFIRPSRSEGMGNSFIEAMGAGLPVIATQVGGIADFLFDAKRNPDRPATGFAVDPDAPDQIVEAVEYIRSTNAEVQSVVARARSLVRERYGWEKIAQDMHGAFDRAIASR